MPTAKTNKRRNSGGSPNLGPSHKTPRVDGGSGDGLSSLEQLTKFSTVVADTADFESIKELHATDATTNPTLVLQAATNPKYSHVIEEAVKEAKAAAKGKHNDAVVEDAVDRVLVGFGVELLKIVPGLVSTEISADLSFDQKGSVERAKKIIELYKAKGIGKERVLIKVAGTWEGVQAAKELKKEDINCNVTLIFSLCQAIAAGEAGAFLISPFVGRILDWHKKHNPNAKFAGEEDPGVKSVMQIYNYFKHFGVKTVVMGASFRNTDEILSLAGCDKLTIAPKLLTELRGSKSEVRQRLNAAEAKKEKINKINLDEKKFRWMLNEDAMATEKLAEGIRNFAADMEKLRAKIREMI